MSPVTVDATFVVQDENRKLSFSGVKLAAASTLEDGKQRWTEMALYRTVGGAYVIEIIGRSTRDGERDICTARVCDDAAAVVASLNRTDDHGVQFLSQVARDLLDEATQLDYDIAEEYGTHHID